jgi:hypothetical protein
VVAAVYWYLRSKSLTFTFSQFHGALIYSNVNISELKHPTFYLEDSLPCSQTCLFNLYPSHIMTLCSLKIHLNIVFPSTLWCPNWFSIPSKFLYGYLISHFWPITLLRFITACDIKIVMFVVIRRLQNETPFNNCIYLSVQYSPVHRQR